MKKAFTLIELMVVISISSLLLLVTANFLIFSIQRNNQAYIENEVRNEANFLMDSIGKDARNSSCECLSSAGDAIYFFGTSSCDKTFCLNGGTIVSGPAPYAGYTIDATTLALKKNGNEISSNAVKVQSCTDCACASGVNGFFVSQPVPGIRSYDVSLSLRQAKNNPRSDFCGKVFIKQSFEPRNK